MKANVLNLDGKQKAEIQLPEQFQEEIRPDLINRAFLAYRSTLYQPKGHFLLAGLQTSAAYYGRRHAWRQTINTGRSRLPREKIAGGRSGRVLIVPHAVKGRRAHPPKVEKKIIEKINLKEKNAAIRSAISASCDAKLLTQRGHIFAGKAPLILDNEFESMKKVKDVRATLGKIGIEQDLQRAINGRKKRSGISGLRRGGYYTPKSALIVIAEDKGIAKAARNIPGVDVAKISQLNADLLAPGGIAGRLIIWTQNAVEKLGKEKLYM